MPDSVLSSRRFSDLYKDGCEHCDPGQQAEASLVQGPHAIRTTWVKLPRPRCERCEFILLVQAIDHLVPVGDVAAWLNRPNLDLDGRTPAECIEAKENDAVFRALFLLDATEPAACS